MPLSRRMTVALGFATAWPAFYMFLFMAVIPPTLEWANRTGLIRPHSQVGVLVVGAAHVATILLTVALAAFYFLYLSYTDRVRPGRRLLWAVGFVLANVIAMPLFFYFYVWPDRAPHAPESQSPPTGGA